MSKGSVPWRKRFSEKLGEDENDVDVDEVTHLRMALLHSNPDAIHGQIWDYHYVFPDLGDEPPVEVYEEEERVGARITKVHWLESYDATALKVMHECPNLSISKVYRHWEQIAADLRGDEPLPYNILWAGSWLFELVGTYEEEEPANHRELYEDGVWLMSVRAEFHKVVVFPPLEYVLQFARKHIYLTHLTERVKLPVNISIPVTSLVPGHDSKSLRLAIDEFAHTWNIGRLVLKREISGRGNHVFVGTPSKLRREQLDSLQWFLQPYQEAFDRGFEFRMYVVLGQCKWGVATQKGDSKEVPCLPIYPKTSLWDVKGGVFAASAAEVIAREFACSLDSPSWLCASPGKVWFLRVDLVCLGRANYDTWLLNELEFFGNADLHFECMKDFPVLFEEMHLMAACFLGRTIADATGVPIPDEMDLEARLRRQRMVKPDKLQAKSRKRTASGPPPPTRNKSPSTSSSSSSSASSTPKSRQRLEEGQKARRREFIIIHSRSPSPSTSSSDDDDNDDDEDRRGGGGGGDNDDQVVMIDVEPLDSAESAGLFCHPAAEEK